METDLEFYRRRAREEREAADTSLSSEAKKSHQKLASRYDRKVRARARINNKPLPGFLIKFQVRNGLGAMPAFSKEHVSPEELDASSNISNICAKGSRCPARSISEPLRAEISPDRQSACWPMGNPPATPASNEQEVAMNNLNPRSTARIADHPVHPMLIPFPIAFLVGTLISDIIYWRTVDAFWATASVYLLVAAIITAALAAVAGFTDFFGDRRIRRLAHAWQHMIGNLIAVLLSIGNLLIRLGDPEGATVPVGLVISAAVVILLLFTGWRGGDLVYRHRVGVPDQVV